MKRAVEWLRCHITPVQVGIFVCSVASLKLLARPGWEWLGYCLAVAGQPLWLLDSWQRRQWGVFVVSLVYAWFWIEGAVAHFPETEWWRVLYG